MLELMGMVSTICSGSHINVFMNITNNDKSVVPGQFSK